LQREQPEKDEQNVDFAHPWKNFCGHLWLLSPVQQALTYSLGKSGEANYVWNWKQNKSHCDDPTVLE